MHGNLWVKDIGQLLGSRYSIADWSDHDVDTIQEPSGDEPRASGHGEDHQEHGDELPEAMGPRQGAVVRTPNTSLQA